MELGHNQYLSIHRKTTAIVTTILLLLTMGASAAHAYDRTWKYSGSFKASLTSGSFYNNKAGTIRVTVDAGNCTVGHPLPEYNYPYINFQLKRQETIGWSTVGSTKRVYCSGGVYTFLYSNARKGTYRMYFFRSGPTMHDENTKTVKGVVSYW